MNAGPDVERLISGWLLEEAPGRAPDRILEAAGRTIDRTHQRRFVAGWRPRTMFERLAAAAVSAVLAIGAITLGASLITAPDNAARPCPATFDEADAVDTFAPGLSQAQRAWGIAGGAPQAIRPGVIAAFSAEPAGSPESVITIDPETGGQCHLVRFRSTQLIQGPGVTTLDWSPAGDALAIGVRRFEDGEERDGQVLIWTPKRLLRIWLGDGAAPGVEWAPDGRSIAVWKAWPLSGSIDSPETSPETRVVHADGSADRTYGIQPFADGLNWSPDGARWIVIQGTTMKADQPTSASIVDVTDGRVSPINLAIGHYATMGWIDDGRVLLRELMDPGVRYLDVPVVAPADVAILPIPDEGSSHELALSPDGRRVAYATPTGLAIVDVAAGSASPPGQVEVAGAAGAVGWPSWSPDGERVIFYAGGAPWVVNADGTGLRQLVAGNVASFDNPWQPVPVQ